MKLFLSLFKKLLTAKAWFMKASWKKKLLSIGIMGLVIWFIYSRLIGAKPSIQYQTTRAERGILVLSVSASGQVSAANSSPVLTQMSGVVSKVYVKNGDSVQAGDKIAELDLDQPSKQKQDQAYASYLSAKNTLDSANATLYTLQSKMYTAWQKYMDIAQNSTYQNSDGSANNTNRVLTQFTVPQADWQAAQDQFKNQQAVIAQAQSALNSSWLLYQQSSSTITSPIAGKVDGLTLQEGVVLSAQATTTTASSQKVATIKTAGQPLINVSLSEIDAPKVAVGQKVTLTFDAFPGKIFTGRVFSIDSTGTVTSGVTTYPVLVQLDSTRTNILPNMSATVNIITKTKDNVILVPSFAIHTQNGQTTAQIMRRGKVTSVPVTVGDASDSQTEITQGISEGDTVVTAITARNDTNNTSPFSARFGGFGGGGGRAIGR